MSDFEHDDEESWLDDDVAEDDDATTIPCPNCGAAVYDDADWCPSCDRYITASTHPWVGRPWWWIGLGLAGIAAVVYLSMPR